MAEKQNNLHYQIAFLTRLKAEIVADAKEHPTKVWGGCGFIAAMMKIDKIVGSLMEQQTRIIDLECLLEIEREENAEYHKVCGDLEDLRKEERNDET